jgi:hypothetical protein
MSFINLLETAWPRFCPKKELALKRINPIFSHLKSKPKNGKEAAAGGQKPRD